MLDPDHKNPWLKHNKQQMRRDWLATYGPYWLGLTIAVVVAALGLAVIL